jgi:hypothetical protein
MRLPSCDSAQVVYANKGNNTYDKSKGRIKCNPNGGGGFVVIAYYFIHVQLLKYFIS